ncbi:MAG: hypothetical protein JWO96_219 [Candidatus Saccharibacteria bacterium]|nr:hypothetical protein [Candidatus Saccharibacteria bacterium]
MLLAGFLVVVIAIIVAIVLAQRYYLTPHNVRNAMKNAVDLAQPSIISTTTAPVSVKCAPSEFETICKSQLAFGSSGKSTKQLEDYAFSTSSTMQQNGWSIYKGDSSSDGITYIYRIISKKFGKAYCEVLINYASTDPVSKASPSYYQSISCSRSVSTFGLF